MFDLACLVNVFVSTHNRNQTAQYVRIGVGRDYADVPPTRGIFKGNATEKMDIEVTVTQV